MDWQEMAALGIVAVTALGMGWRCVRPARSRGKGRSAVCGCAASGSSPPRETLVFHARKGEPAQVWIRAAPTGGHRESRPRPAPARGAEDASPPALPTHPHLETRGQVH